MEEKILLDKWQTLESDEQEEVLALINSIIEKKQQNKLHQLRENIYQPQTELGKKLWELRLKSLGKQPLLNSWEEVEEELAKRREGI